MWYRKYEEIKQMEHEIELLKKKIIAIERNIQNMAFDMVALNITSGSKREKLTKELKEKIELKQQESTILKNKLEDLYSRWQARKKKIEPLENRLAKKLEFAYIPPKSKTSQSTKMQFLEGQNLNEILRQTVFSNIDKLRTLKSMLIAIVQGNSTILGSQLILITPFGNYKYSKQKVNTSSQNGPNSFCFRNRLFSQVKSTEHNNSAHSSTNARKSTKENFGDCILRCQR